MSTNINFEESIDSLIKQGFAIFSTKLQRQIFEAQLESIKKVIAANPGLKYCPDKDKPEHDRGIFRRNKSEGKDNKWCAHYRPTLCREIENQEIYIWGYEHKDFNNYREHSEFIFQSASEMCLNIVKSIDEKIPEYKLFTLYKETNRLDLNCQRSIIYDEPDTDLTVANDHTDRNFITLAMYESHPGLFLIQKDGSVYRHNYKEKQVLVFWGRKAHALTNGLLREVRHGVDVFKKGIQRDSSVFFGHTIYPHIPG